MSKLPDELFEAIRDDAERGPVQATPGSPERVRGVLLYHLAGAALWINQHVDDPAFSDERFREEVAERFGALPPRGATTPARP